MKDFDAKPKVDTSMKIGKDILKRNIRGLEL